MSCYDESLLYESYRKKKFSFCEKIFVQDMKLQCMNKMNYIFALSEKSIDRCNKISMDAKLLIECKEQLILFDVAQTGDIKQCFEMSSMKLKNDCVTHGIYASAVEQKDVEKCEQLNSKKNIEECRNIIVEISSTPSALDENCNIIKDSYERVKCRDDYEIKRAINSKIYSRCKRVKDKKNQTACFWNVFDVQNMNMKSENEHKFKEKKDLITKCINQASDISKCFK